MKAVISIGDLLKSIDIGIDDLKLLPICHTRPLDEILNVVIVEPKLKPQKSKDYSDTDLIFFFYGKAKYIPDEDVKNIFGSSPPVTLIFDLDKNIKRFVCFDSGGYKLYEMEKLDRKHFEIENCEPDLIKKYVKIFYKTNKNYLNKKFNYSLEAKIYPLCRALEELYRLAKDVKARKKSIKYGEQAFTIEIQFDEEFNLTPKVAVVPISIVSSKFGRDQLKSLFNDTELVDYNNNGVIIQSYLNMSTAVKEKIIKMTC